MPNGALDQSVAFDEPTQTQDGSGGTDAGWAEMHACRARFRYLRGGETVMAARLEGRQPVLVSIWNCAAARTITTSGLMRDVRTGDVYNVRSIVPTDDRLSLELLCERGVGL